MKFISVRGEAAAAGFREALLQGIAPDGGLYVPESGPRLPEEFLRNLPGFSFHEIARTVLASFIDDIPGADLRGIVERSLNFPIPLVRIDEDRFLLELFHGPTLAFKDVGARFMAEALSWFLEKEGGSLTILVATSGDTGGAVASGFFNVPRLDVFIFYPSGRISELQEKQMTTLGGNIHPVEVEGTFDDCQRMVKEALADGEIRRRRRLSTANSINPGRLLPQITYYVWALAQWKRSEDRGRTDPAVVVPSGNFGNLTAAVYAARMGVQIARLVAATNANDVVPEYLRTGSFTPRPSISTLSNAMDVGDPSNLSRLQHLSGNDLNQLRALIEPQVVSDEETLNEIRQTYEQSGRIIDPHTAVGMAAARRTPGMKIIAATAHPAKFPEVIQRAISATPGPPPSLKEAMGRPTVSIRIPVSAEAVKEILLSGV